MPRRFREDPDDWEDDDRFRGSQRGEQPYDGRDARYGGPADRQLRPQEVDPEYIGYGLGGYGADDSTYGGPELRGFRGRGPKNYQRPDERIREDVNDRLTDDDRIDASEIDVTVDGAEVTLSGSVSSRGEKRLAEDIAESCGGVKDVHNRLKVSRRNSAE